MSFENKDRQYPIILPDTIYTNLDKYIHYMLKIFIQMYFDEY